MTTQLIAQPLQTLGNSAATSLLRSAIEKHRIAPAYIFTGRPGIGKHQTALWFANTLLQVEGKPIRGTVHPDLMSVEPTFNHEGKLYTLQEATAQKIPHKSAQIRIEQVRQLTADLQRKPLYAKRSVAIVDQAELMTEAATNALLKTLEEPGGSVLILVVNQIDRILPTIISRCQVIPFYPLNPVQMQQALELALPQCLECPELLEFAQGSPGQAIGAYHQLQSLQLAGFSCTHNTGTVSECFQVAKQVCALDQSLQQWLLDLWQVMLWKRHQSPDILQALEQAKRYLKQNCSPQSVWENVFLKLRNTHSRWEIPEVAVVPESVVEVETKVLPKSTEVKEKRAIDKNAKKSQSVVAEVVKQPGLFD